MDNPIQSSSQPPEKPRWVQLPVLRGVDEIIDIIELAFQCNAWIAGGYVRYMCSPCGEPVKPVTTEELLERIKNGLGPEPEPLEQVMERDMQVVPLPLVKASDVDLFPKTQEDFDTLCTALEENHPRTYENDMCITFRWEDDSENEQVKIQVIKPTAEGQIKTTGTLEEVLDYFDFTVVRIGLIDEKTALADVDFVEDEKIHRLRIKHIACPVSSVTRIAKYCRKGYFIGVGQILKLFQDWDERGNEYRNRIIDLVNKQVETGEISQEEINELEHLLRID